MALQNQNVDQPSGARESRTPSNGVSNFLSGVAVLLSTLALLFSGFTAYQVFTLQQTLNANRNAGSGTAIAPTQTSPTPATADSNTAPTPNTSTPASYNSIAIQPGQFVQSAFGTKGQVELLSVKRIQDPETGTRNVVNLQMRIRRIEPDRVYGSNAIYVGGTTARNPETSETYKAVSFDRSTGSVSLFSMRTGGCECQKQSIP